MEISANAIISNSDMIKNYKSSREKAEKFGKVFVFKNNQVDAVLFSIAEYERLSGIIEHLNNLDKNEVEKFLENISKL